MRIDVNQNEIDKLEKVLDDFKKEWEVLQNRRSSTWRKYFAISFVVALLLTIITPTLWWCGVFVVGYFAGSLFAMLRQNAKTSHQIVEHQKQLKLVRLLRKFQSSPYSQE